MKKSDEIKARLESLKTEAQALLDENKIEDAKAKMQEVKDCKAALELQEQLESEMQLELEAKTQTALQAGGNEDMKAKENANVIRAMLKKVTGGRLTDAENALLLPTTSNPTGENGESYILPQDIRTMIHKKLKEYRSLREVLGYIPTTALTGSFPVEDFDTVSELIDFADGTDGTFSDDIRFKNISFALKEKAAFVKLSNSLLSLTDNALISYVVEIFSKKAVVTENRIAIAALKKNKTVRTLSGWQALKSSLNVDLDPAVLFGTVILTNQDGFDYMDKALDTNGRPILQTDVANPTRKLFAGYPVYVYSNSMLPTAPATKSTKAKAPVIYGNLKEAVKFVDLSGRISFATSREAGFMSNTTIARLIEFIDIIQCESSDKCYIYGEFETADILPA